MFRRVALIFFLFFSLLCFSGPSQAGYFTNHLISFQGRALDANNDPMVTGDVAVRIYDAATDGNLIYDSGIEFQNTIENGIFDILLGSGTILSLDNTQLYFLELDLDGDEVIGDAASGRQAFYPGGGSHERPDLEQRITALESYLDFDCDPGTFDLNGNAQDQCEFTLDPAGIYVDANNGLDEFGSGFGPIGTGSGNIPCQTISYAINQALANARTTVYVAEGIYLESIILTSGINLRGGYRADTWERHLESTSTILIGADSFGNRKTIEGQGINQSTLVEGFIIQGQDNPEPGGNSYAVYLSDAGGVTLQHNIIFAGNGGAGPNGTTGSDGGSGVAGGYGLDALSTNQNVCTGTSVGGAGGPRSCDGFDISGGDGGDAVCPPVLIQRADSGSVGAGSGGGTGGVGGYDREYDGSACLTGGYSAEGQDGADGADGLFGSAGWGATLGSGSVIGSEWSGMIGSDGEDGFPGGGGGGGGAGGGVDAVHGVPPGDIRGSSGGGGGSGGCLGYGGGGGQAGGGSFAVFVTGGTAPVIQDNRFYLGSGGSGGRGGRGGIGGVGAQGGLGGSNGVFFCEGSGGSGGSGGDGGHGGGGGGGAGGVAYGIYIDSVSGAPGYCISGMNNEFQGGNSGQGGEGGPSLGNTGSDGVAGIVADCN